MEMQHAEPPGPCRNTHCCLGFGIKNSCPCTGSVNVKTHPLPGSTAPSPPDTMRPPARSPAEQEPLPAFPALLWPRGPWGPWGPRLRWPQRGGGKILLASGSRIMGQNKGVLGRAGGTPGLLPHRRSPPGSPDEVAAEDEAEHKDEDAGAENDHVDVQWQILERDGRHRAGFTGINQSQTAGAPFGGESQCLGGRRGQRSEEEVR